MKWITYFLASSLLAVAPVYAEAKSYGMGATNVGATDSKKALVAAGCPGSTDFSGMVFMWNFNADGGCSTGFDENTYTTSATTEHPASLALVYALNTGDGTDVQFGTTSDGSLDPDNDCVVRFLATTSSADNAAHIRAVNSSIMDTTVTDNATLGFTWRGDTAYNTNRNLLQVGSNTDNTIQILAETTGDLKCSIDPASGAIRSLSTATNEGNLCCEGSACTGLLFDGTERTFECTATNNGSSDEFRILVNGCIVNDWGTGVIFSDPMLNFTSTEHITLGNTASFRTSDWSIGLMGLHGTYQYDFFDKWSGGDDTYGDGNECWNCDDPDDGTRCDD